MLKVIRSAFAELFAPASKRYESGTRRGPNDMWAPKALRGPDELRRYLKTSIQRCRAVSRDAPFVSGAVTRGVNNAIRSGIYPQFIIRDKRGNVDTDASEQWDALFTRWAAKASFLRDEHYGDLQCLGCRHIWTDGGYLLRKVVISNSPSGVVPLRLELLEVTDLDSSVDRDTGGTVISGGIETKKSSGEVIRYHMIIDNERFTLEADDVAFVFQRSRIAHNKGIPLLSPVVMESHDVHEFRSNMRIRARAENSFAGFIKQKDTGLPPIGAGLLAPGEEGHPSSGDESFQNPVTEIKAGMIQTLPDGTDVVFSALNTPGDNYGAFVTDSLRGMAAGVNQDYASFANDQTKSSYSAVRAGSLETRLSYEAVQVLVARKDLSRVVRWFMEVAWLAGLAPMSADDFPRRVEEYVTMFKPKFPGWPMISPKDDATAASTLLEQYMSSRTELLNGRGLSFDKIVEDRLKEAELIQKVREAEGANNAE